MRTRTKMPPIEYQSGSIELIDQLRSLWKELNEHHQEISPYFAKAFEEFTFEDRMASAKEHSNKTLQVQIALESPSKEAVGYCISTISADNRGEIDSLFVRQSFRNLGIASELMNRALSWLDSQNVIEKNIGVVHGNENAYPFYAKFGFLPRITFLRQIND